MSVKQFLLIARNWGDKRYSIAKKTGKDRIIFLTLDPYGYGDTATRQLSYYTNLVGVYTITEYDTVEEAEAAMCLEVL